MPENKKTAVDLCFYRLSKAENEIAISELLLEHEMLNKALNSAYYSIFHAMRALLALKQLDSKTHAGVMALFSRHYVGVAEFDRDFVRDAMAAQRLRQNSDYVDFFEPELELVAEQLDAARRFVAKVRAYAEHELSN